MVKDIENEVRELLAERAGEGIGWPPAGLPPRVRRRIRIRQTATVVLTSLAVAIIGIGVAASIRAIQGDPSRLGSDVIYPTPAKTFLRDKGVEAFILASGGESQNSWKLVAYQERPNDPCLELHRTSENSGAGACQFTVPDEQAMESQIAEPDAKGQLRIVFGAVTKEAVRITIRLFNGADIKSHLLALPASLDAPFNAFVAEIPAGRDAEIKVLDRNGNVLATEELGPPPPEPEPGKRVGVSDSHGNFIGSLPSEYLFAEPTEPPPAQAQDPPWSPPGSPAPVEVIRHVASSPLRVRPELRKWWTNRPDPSGQNQEFVEWWAKYPFKGPVDEQPEPT